MAAKKKPNPFAKGKAAEKMPAKGKKKGFVPFGKKSK